LIYENVVISIESA